jgi:hypothetical protein
MGLTDEQLKLFRKMSVKDQMTAIMQLAQGVAFDEIKF